MLLGNVLVAFIGIVALRVYTELAPADVFGQANLVLGALALGTQVLIQPINATQIRYHTEAVQAGQGDSFTVTVLVWALIASGGMTALVCIIFVFGLAAHVPLASLSLLLAVVGLILLSSVRHVLMSRMHAEQRMSIYMGFRVVEAMAAVFATAFVLSLVQRTESFVWGQVFAMIVTVAGIVLFSPASIQCLFGTHRMPGMLPKLRQYGAPFVPMALLTWLSSLADRYVLAGLLGTAVAGQYLAAFAIASSGFSIANGAMSDLFRAKLFDAENSRDYLGAHRIFLAWLCCYAAISLFGLAAILLFGDLIVDLVLARSYRSGAVQIMFWVALGYAVNGMTIAFENRIFSLGHSRKVLWPLAAGALSNIIFSCIFIPWNGATGAAQASCAGFAVRALITTVVLARALRDRN